MTVFLQQLINGLATGSYYMLLAVGLSIIFGILGICHFAQGAVAIMGGYACLYLMNYLQIDFFLAIFISMIVVGLVGMIVCKTAYGTVLESNSVNAFIIALGLSTVIENLMTIFIGAQQVSIKTSYTDVIRFGDNLSISEIRVLIIVVSFALVLALYLYMKHAKFGKAIRAMSQNKDASKLMGINTSLIISLVFFISSLMAAVSGAFMGAQFSIYPSSGTNAIMKGFAVLVLGGLGSFQGAIVGAMIIGVVESMAAMYISSIFKDMYCFVLMIIVLLIYPKGLFGGKENVKL